MYKCRKDNNVVVDVVAYAVFIVTFFYFVLFLKLRANKLQYASM